MVAVLVVQMQSIKSQFSLWAMMNSPLYASNDLRNMNDATKKILLNDEVIALNQDTCGQTGH